MTTPAKDGIQTRPSPMVHFMPILAWLPNYERTWLRADLIAGLTVVALLIPEGMAYAEIAGVPPKAAFYAAPIGLLLFAIFGTSRQLVVAVSAAIATMSYATVSELVPPNTSEFIVMTAALAMLAGLICILAGVLKLGQVAQFFTPIFYLLPEATLGAIVVVAISGMVKVAKLKHLYHVRRVDFILAVVALLAVLTFETLQALLFAVIISIFALVWYASKPKLAMLGSVPKRLEYSDIRKTTPCQAC